MEENPNNPAINFNLNWNGKLFCNAFTTIRPRNDDKYQVGKIYNIYKMGVFFGDVKIVFLRHLKLADITEPIAYIDTGYCKADTIEIFSDLYAAKLNNIESQEFTYMLLERITKDVNHNDQKNEKTANSNAIVPG